MSGKGKGKARRHRVQKKDKQRKRWGSLPVSVPLKGGVSVFKVSVPLSSLPSDISPHQHASITSHTASVSTERQLHIKGYDRVLSKLSDITETLKLNSDAKDKLTSLYQKHKWLNIAAKPAEDDLVKLALDRIKQDPSQFDAFISMLQDTEGMDLIVETLTGDVTSLHTPSLSTSSPPHIPPAKRIKTARSCLLPPSPSPLPSSSTSTSPSVPTTSPVLSRYADYLRAVYSTCPVAKCDKFPPTPGKMFIKLALVKKEKMSQARADKFTRLTLRGDIDQILRFKEPIEMDDILKEDDKVRLVVVEGAPGIGKSTFAWELCRQWPTLESLKRFSLVVLLRLREEGVQSATDISHLFPCGDDPDLSSLVAEEVKSKNGDGVLFVFDGFDEFPTKLKENSLVMDIISGSKYLPKATVLVTSRPSASAQLQGLLQGGVGKHTEIVGFSEEAIFEFAHSVFGDTSLFTDFRAYLTANPVVKGLMYNPLNCAIVVGVYQDTYESGKLVPHTQTQLYTELTLCLLSRYLSAAGEPLARKLPDKLEDLPRDSDLYQQLVKVGKLAFNGKLRDEVIFKQLPVGCSDLGLLVKHTALYTRKESATYNFFHLTLQEYMSAFYISQLPADEQRTLFSEHSTTSMEVVWRFVAGLTKMQNIGWDEFKRVKKKGVSDEDYVYQVEDDLVAAGPFLLQCLYEAQDIKCCENVFCQHLVEFHPIGESLDYCLALGYCISACSNSWDVDMHDIPSEGLEMLGHGMKSVDYGGGDIVTLQLLGCGGIGEHLLQMPHEIFQYTSDLILRFSNIDHRWLDNLAECIPYLPSLTTLEIGDFIEDNVTSVKLLQALKEHGKLETLNMEMDICMDDVAALADQIQQPSSSLRELAVGKLYMDSSVVKQLIQQCVMSPSSLDRVTIRDCYPLGDLETISVNISTLSFEHDSDAFFDDSSLDNSDDSSDDLDTSPSPLTANPSRVKDGTKLSNILRDSISLKVLKLHIPLLNDEVQNIIDSLKDNQSLKRLELSEEYHSKYFSESELHALDPRINFYSSSYSG